MKEYKQECIDAEETDDVPVISNYIGECFLKIHKDYLIVQTLSTTLIEMK